MEKRSGGFASCTGKRPTWKCNAAPIAATINTTAAPIAVTRVLEMRRTEPIAGFPRGLPVNGTMTWEPAADLLTGATGIALALHAAISSIEPAWDQLLLADLSPAT